MEVTNYDTKVPIVLLLLVSFWLSGCLFEIAVRYFLGGSFIVTV